MKLDLDAMKKRCEAATPGPWVSEGRWLRTEADKSEGHRYEIPGPNGKFVAAARTDLPAAIEAIEKMRDALRMQRQIVSDCQTPGNSRAIAVENIARDVLRELFGEE